MRFHLWKPLAPEDARDETTIVDPKTWKEYQNLGNCTDIKACCDMLWCDENLIVFTIKSQRTEIDKIIKILDALTSTRASLINRIQENYTPEIEEELKAIEKIIEEVKKKKGTQLILDL